MIWSEEDNISWGSDFPQGVAVDDTGIYVVGGHGITGLPAGNTAWRIEKRDKDTGAIIWDQDENPTAGTDMGDIFAAVTLDNTGVYVVGYDNPGLFNTRWVVQKRDLNNGTVIWSEIVDISARLDLPQSVAIDSTGVYIAGITDNSNYRIEKRSLSDGSVLWSQTFGWGPPGIMGMKSNAISVDSTGIYFIHTDSANNWIVEKRDLSDGSPIWSESAYYSGDLWPIDVTVDETGLYVIGGHYIRFSMFPPANIYRHRWIIEQRDPSDGSLLWSYTDADTQRVAHAVALGGTYMYIGGLENLDPANQLSNFDDKRWRVEQWEKEEGFVDIGLRVYDENVGPITIAAWPLGQEANSPLRIAKDTDGDTVPEVYGIVLVDPGDSMDSGVRIQIEGASGPEIKALRKIGATSHWEEVDDVVPDDFGTYVWTDSGSEQKDAYNLQDPSAVGTINQIRVWVRFQGTIRNYLRLNGVESVFPVSGTAGGGWTDQFTSWQPSRPGGGSWTWDDIRDLQVVAGLSTWTPFGTTYQGRLTQIYIEVDYSGGTLILRPDADGDYINIDNP